MPHPSYARLADAVRGMVRDEARVASPPVECWRVLRSDPLLLDQINGDVQLEEGDPDVVIDRGVLADRPAEGALVRVHHDGDDWIVAGVIDA